MPARVLLYLLVLRRLPLRRHHLDRCRHPCHHPRLSLKRLRPLERQEGDRNPSPKRHHKLSRQNRPMLDPRPAGQRATWITLCRTSLLLFEGTMKYLIAGKVRRLYMISATNAHNLCPDDVPQKPEGTTPAQKAAPKIISLDSSTDDDTLESDSEGDDKSGKHKKKPKITKKPVAPARATASPSKK